MRLGASIPGFRDLGLGFGDSGFGLGVYRALLLVGSVAQDGEVAARQRRPSEYTTTLVPHGRLRASSKVNSPHPIDFRASCGANLI